MLMQGGVRLQEIGFWICDFLQEIKKAGRFYPSGLNAIAVRPGAMHCHTEPLPRRAQLCVAVPLPRTTEPCPCLAAYRLCPAALGLCAPALGYAFASLSLAVLRLCGTKLRDAVAKLNHA